MKVLKKISEEICEYSLGWRLSRNRYLCELLVVPDVVKYIEFKKLQWVVVVVRLDNAPQKKY
jgi:hypothetical protein